MVVDHPNQEILREVNQANAWFLAKKTRPIWAKLVSEDQTVETLEGSVAVQAGDFLCSGGISGDVWPYSAEALNRKYHPTVTFDDAGWRRYEPTPDAEGVFAASVAHPFVVQASWGRLQGKSGDFIVKNASDKEVPYPADVWIVDREAIPEYV